MTLPDSQTVTAILESTVAGTATREMTDQLYEAVYRQLRRIAGDLMRSQSPDHSLRPTDLVHEAYLKLVGSSSVDWQGRAHLLRTAAQVMRQILVDHARRRATQKHGGGWRRITLSGVTQIGAQPELEILALNEALAKLREQDERMANVVELRVFGGMTAQETAYVLGVSKRTADADWKVARVWLADEMAPQ
jgi:RNA polymerase sigma factor (TIGR02999 family)